MGKCSTKTLIRTTIVCLALLFLCALYQLLFGLSLTYLIPFSSEFLGSQGFLTFLLVSRYVDAGFRVVSFLGLAWVACETVYRISTLYEHRNDR